jgi:ribosomal protein S18 acetylase RimI-like enzyme
MRPHDIIVRYATLADLDDLVELLRDLFSIEADFTFHETTQRRGLKLMLDGGPNHQCVLVAEAEGQVVGMCSAQTRISTAAGKTVAVVEDVVVSKKWRGKGIGHRLMKEIEKWGRIRRIKHFQLLADRNNARGITFYQKQKWVVTQLVCLTKRVD